MLFLFYKILNKSFASYCDITIGDLKIAGIPRVGNVCATCEVKKLHNLVLRIRAENAVHITDICAIHTDEKIVFCIIGAAKLRGLTAAIRYGIFIKNTLCTMVDIIADFLGGGCGGFGCKDIREATLFHHIKENVFCHGTAAYVAVTHKHYFFH